MENVKAENKETKTWWTRRRAIAAIVALAFVLRLWAALQLPEDFDEPVYIATAYDYAEALDARDLEGVVEYRQNSEHPALVKILYGLAVLALGENPAYPDAIFAARLLSALFGTLAAWLLALVNPLAGAMLAVQTLVVKYTSQAYLEALPHFTSMAAVLAFLRFSKEIQDEVGILPRSKWFWLSAAALGITAASKYTYLPILFVILFLAFQIRRNKFSLQALLPYLLFAIFIFWTFNPPLWRDPFGRFFESLSFHPQYAQSEHVEASGYRWYQPVLWIAHSAGFQFHPDVFIYYGFDGLIFLLGLAGMPREWRGRRWVPFWFLAGLLFLLYWPVKWPQYTMVVIPALCLSASVTAERLYRAIVEYESYYGTLREMFPRPPKAFWVMIGTVLLALLVGTIANSISVARGRMGWSQIRSSSSFLPPGSIYAILPGTDGQMVIGTEWGIAFWTPPAATDLPDTWVIYNSKNSSLAHDRVLSLARDEYGTLWAGTQAGVSRYDGAAWLSFRADDLGLPAAQINALAAGSQGTLWAGSSSGVAFYDGQSWRSYAVSNGLIHEAVFAVAVERLATGDRVWFGTLEGVSSLNTGTEEWASYSKLDLNISRGGISDLLVDSVGRLWMASQGGGLYWWDGEGWQVYRTSNSDIPYNSVQSVAESSDGIIWAGLSFPNTSGGLVVSFQDDAWRSYTSRNSGFSGAEPISLAFDSFGRLWIGNRTSGIDIFQYER
jgi:hypothetical protein